MTRDGETPAERFRKARELFFQASEFPQEGRSAFLEEACAGDASLRAEVEALLRSSGEAGSLLRGVAEASAASFDSPGPALPSRIGPYELVREIGHGGMGTVYLAVRSDAGFEKKVALKVISRGMDTDFVVRRFLAERQILASLDHPNIARLYDGGATSDGLPWFAMEYIEGEHLLEHSDRKGLSVRERVELFRQVCAGVQYAHQSLVVHRDIKPGNILVTADGTAKLLDFGLAKLLLPESSPATVEVTATAVRMFTPEYASPEQVRGERITTASDVYSLGVVLYRLLTGRTPYRLTSRSAEEIARAVTEQDAEPATRTIGSDLDNILRMALRKDPRRRYGSAEQLSEDLRRYLEELPVAARPDTLSYRASKFIVRHRLGVAAAVLVATSLVAGAGTALWQAGRAREKAALAERRFNDVRKLANTYLFEFHDAIKDLAGSTKARELLVTRALEVLGSLAKEAGNDPALQRELAEAYARVGDVQGGLGPNLGEARSALASHLAALRLREALVRASPKSGRDRQALGETLQRVSEAQYATGSVAEALGSARRAEDVLRSLIADEPGELSYRIALQSAQLSLGDALATDGRLEEALVVHRRRTAECELLAAANPGQFRVRRSLAIGHYKIGQTLMEMKRWPDALGELQKASDLWEGFAREDPKSVPLQRDVSFVLTTTGQVLGELQRYPEAVEKLRGAVSICEKLSSADPNDAEGRIFLADGTSLLGANLVRAGRAEEGLADLSKAVDLFRDGRAKDPENASVGDALHAAYDRLASAHAFLAERAAGPARREELRAARDAYVRDRELLLELEARGQLLGISARDLLTVDARIAACEAGLRAPLRAAPRRDRRQGD